MIRIARLPIELHELMQCRVDVPLTMTPDPTECAELGINMKLDFAVDRALLYVANIFFYVHGVTFTDEKTS